MVCQRCGCPDLEYVQAAARCRRCFALYAPRDGGWVPLHVEAPGGPNEDFNQVFEQQLGFGPRPMGGMAPAPANPIARYMSIGIGCFVFFVLAAVGLYVAMVLRSSMP